MADTADELLGSLKDMGVGTPKDLEILDERAAEIVFQLLTSDESIFNRILKMYRKLDFASRRVKYYQVVAAPPHTMEIRLFGNYHKKPFMPSAVWQATDNKGNIHTQVLYRLDVDLNPYQTESFGLTPDGQIAFMGSNGNAIIDTPAKLNGRYSFGHRTPWYIVSRMFEAGIVPRIFTDLKPVKPLTMDDILKDES